MSEAKIIPVVYKFIDGAHIFSSTDPLARGLYAASTDLQEAYNDVPIQVKKLLKLNHQIEDEVVHQVSFQDFLDQLLSSVSHTLATKNKVITHEKAYGVAPPPSAISLRITEMAAA